MKKMKQYTTPVVKVVAFQIEHGFAGSGELRLSLFNEDLEDGFNALKNWKLDTTTRVRKTGWKNPVPYLIDGTTDGGRQMSNIAAERYF